MSNLPDPLVPEGADLRDFGFMPLDVVRLRDSGLAVHASGDEFRAAVLLWCASWHQVPAASLPDDDAMLAHLVGYGRSLKEWKKLRAGALRGWVKCSDGRFYHPVIAEKAVEAWERRGSFSEKSDNKDSRQQRWRKRQKALSEQLRALGVTPPRGAGLETLERLLRDASGDASPSHVDAAEMPLTGTGTGTGTGKEHEHTPGTEIQGTGTRAGSVCARMRRDAGLLDTNPSHSILLELISQGITDDELVSAARTAVSKGKGFAYALATAAGMRSDAASVRIQQPPRLALAAGGSAPIDYHAGLNPDGTPKG